MTDVTSPDLAEQVDMLNEALDATRGVSPPSFTGRALGAGRVQPAAGEALQGDGDGVLGPVGDPGGGLVCGEFGQPGRRDDLLGFADVQDALPGARVRVDLVGLEPTM